MQTAALANALTEIGEGECEENSPSCIITAEIAMDSQPLSFRNAISFLWLTRDKGERRDENTARNRPRTSVPKPFRRFISSHLELMMPLWEISDNCSRIVEFQELGQYTEEPYHILSVRKWRSKKKTYFFIEFFSNISEFSNIDDYGYANCRGTKKNERIKFTWFQADISHLRCDEQCPYGLSTDGDG